MNTRSGFLIVVGALVFSLTIGLIGGLRAPFAQAEESAIEALEKIAKTGDLHITTKKQNPEEEIEKDDIDMFIRGPYSNRFAMNYAARFIGGRRSTFENRGYFLRYSPSAKSVEPVSPPPRRLSAYHIPASAREGGVDVNIIDYTRAVSGESEGDIKGYRVYRREVGTSEWKFICDNGMKARYLDKDMDPARAYKYEVRSYNDEGALKPIYREWVTISANYESAYDSLKPENVLVLINADDLGLVDIGEVVPGYEDAMGMLDAFTEEDLRYFLGVSQGEADFFSEPDEDGIAYNEEWNVRKDTSTGKIEVPLGIYYAMRRGIPRENILVLDNIPTAEDARMSENAFYGNVINPIKDYLTENDLLSRISSIASVYRFPLTQSWRSWEEMLNFRLWTAFGEESRDIGKRYDAGRHFSRQLGDAGFLTTRIDAQDIATTRRLIDDAIWAETNYAFSDLEWRAESDLNAFIEWHGKYQVGDKWFLEAMDIIGESEFFGGQGENWDAMANDVNEILENYDKDGDGRLDNTFLFSGWYHYRHYQDWFDWARGSIGWSLDSASGSSFRDLESTYGGDTYEYWGGNIINRGACASLGAVAEPYLSGHTQPHLFNYYLLSGYSFAEAGHYASPVYSHDGWRYAFDGDPLYSPFRQAGEANVLETEVVGPDGNRRIYLTNQHEEEATYREYDRDGNLVSEDIGGMLIIYFEGGKSAFYDYRVSSYPRHANLYVYDENGEPLSYGSISYVREQANELVIKREKIILSEEGGVFLYRYYEYDSRMNIFNQDGTLLDFDPIVTNETLLNIEAALRSGNSDMLDPDLIHNIRILDEGRFMEVYSSVLDAVSNRIGLILGSESFISAFDTNRNGEIDTGDYDDIKRVLAGERNVEEVSARLKLIVFAEAMYDQNVMRNPDLNEDGTVELSDRAIMEDAQGSLSGDERYDARADLNKDGKVDELDNQLLEIFWGYGIDPNDGCVIRSPDITGNGVVDFGDLSMFICTLTSQLGDERYDVKTDFNKDDKVDDLDFQIFKIFRPLELDLNLDINKDGKIDRADLAYIEESFSDALQYGYALPTGIGAALDVNRDGSVDDADEDFFKAAIESHMELTELGLHVPEEDPLYTFSSQMAGEDTEVLLLQKQ